MPDLPAPTPAPVAAEAPGLPPPAPRSKRVKKVPLVLTEDQEQDVADWYRSQEMLYNRRMADYKRVDIKSRIIDEKATELGCTTQQLKTWIDSMRTAVGKITDPAKKPSGGAAKVLTDRDSWIMENFGYLEKHIKRVDAGKRKKGGQLSESLSVHKVSSNRGTSDDDTSDPELIIDTSDDARESSDTASRSKGGPFKASSISSTSTKGAPPPTKKTSRRRHQEQQQQDSDASTTESVHQLLQKATSLQMDMQAQIAPTDSASLSKKFFSDMIFHEVMQMDTDTWTDYQAQALQHLMQFKQACRRRRQLQQQQQQQQQYFMPPAPHHQQMYPTPSVGSSTQMFAPLPVGSSTQMFAPTASVGSSSQMFAPTASVGSSSQQFPTASVGSSSQQFPTASVGSSSQQFPTASVGSSAQMFVPSPQARLSSAPQQPAMNPTPPPPGSSAGIISQAWSMIAGPSHGRPALSPVDCSTPQDVSLTSFLLNTSLGGDDQNFRFLCQHLRLPPRSN